MVVLTPRFTLLAALSSIAAVSLLPPAVDAAAIQFQNRDAVGQLLATRHSSHGHAAGEDVSHGHSETSRQKAKDAFSSRTASRKESSGEKPQRLLKPVAPLPARMAAKSAGKASAKKSAAGDGGSASSKDHKHEGSKRALWNPTNPVSRMEQLWSGSRDVQSLPVLDRRHHHHHHSDHEGHHDEVIMKGDNDHVKVHRRAPTAGRAPRAPHEDHDRVVVEGHNDHVHVHNHDSHDDRERVVVKGDNDHVHVHRSPSPHHHSHHESHEKVVVKGDHDSVHVHRSPEPVPHHHHHHDKVIVKGDHDHVNVHRRFPAPHHRHHHTVIVKGDNQHVHAGRSPVPEPHHHHHHHHDEKVIVKGDNDHVNVHERRGPIDRRHSVLIAGDGRTAYLVSNTQPAMASSTLLDVKLHLRRDDQISGVPGSIEIMSPVAGSTSGQRIASLVLAAPSNETAITGNSSSSTFVLNASDSNRTQMYMVKAPDSGDVPSQSSSAAINSTATTSPASFIKVMLQLPVFDAESAQLKPYCATFDPRPVAPAPLTVESCMNGTPSDAHKSQVFAYEPSTGVVRPMWLEGEDDGTGGDTTSDSDASDGDGFPDDDGNAGDTGPSNTTNSTTIDPPTPESDKVASVTSFEQEALEEQFGDATRPPARIASAKAFAADTLASAQNVTLVFSPAAAELHPPGPSPPSQEKIAVQPSSGGSTTSTSLISSASADSSSTALASATTTDTAVTSAAALEATMTASSSGVSSVKTSSSDSSVVASSTVSSSDATTSTSAVTSPTPAALEVKVYNPYAETSGSDATSSESVTATSATSTMTPVSTAPYEWMFKQGALTDLE